VYLQLADISDGLTDGSLHLDFHGTASTTGETVETGEALELSIHSNHFLHRLQVD